MNQIYNLIGQIIENSQYIEWNLALMLRCDTILKEFEKTSSIPLSRFETVVKEAENLAFELGHMTLGEIIRLARETNQLSNYEIESLEKVLRARNYLVHQYFKKHNIEEEKSNPNFLEKEINYLTNILNNMLQVNNALAKIVKFEQEQLDSIR